MSDQGFIYNSALCLCCHACEIACQEAHNLSNGTYFRKVERMTILQNGTPVSVPYSGACNHCHDPACVKVCPTGAMYIREDGVVCHNDGLCISCGACMWNCPYGAVSLSDYTGMAQKCDSCADRRRQNLAPICVNACPTRALRWGDLEEARQLPHNEGLPFLQDPSTTNPRLCVYSDYPPEKEET